MYGGVVKAQVIAMFRDGLEPSRIARKLDMTDSEVCTIVREWWASDKDERVNNRRGGQKNE